MKEDRVDPHPCHDNTGGMNDTQGRSREVIRNFTVRDAVGPFGGDHGSKDFTFAGGGNGCRYRQLVSHIH